MDYGFSIDEIEHWPAKQYPNGVLIHWDPCVDGITKSIGDLLHEFNNVKLRGLRDATERSHTAMRMPGRIKDHYPDSFMYNVHWGYTQQHFERGETPNEKRLV